MILKSETITIIITASITLVTMVVALVGWGMRLEQRFNSVNEAIDINHEVNKVRWQTTEARLDDIEKDIDDLTDLRFLLDIRREEDHEHTQNHCHHCRR